MPNRLTFQEMVWHLTQFWARQGCLVWQPHNIQVGAGTMNPATFLRVLGPEPWRVGYVEPSVRPDDSRYGLNPNRWQQYFQYQVILKPDPGNPQELYLESLAELGLDLKEHDIRFVEDNWETPALGAWGLGWEVWLDGQEVTQFTYFQQAGGVALDPVSVEITYGLERLLMPLQGVASMAELIWTPGIRYGDLFLTAEEEHSRYNLDDADIELLRQQFGIYEQETKNCLAKSLVFPAYDYLLKCSHAFNVLDARGAIGVTERAFFFGRMRTLAAAVCQEYLAQRERQGYPLMQAWPAPAQQVVPALALARTEGPLAPRDFVLEVGTEELPAGDLDSALGQLRELAPAMLSEARLECQALDVLGTPRRLVLYVKGLVPRQKAREIVRRGPPAGVAFDREGKPTRAAEGFAKSAGVSVQDLRVEEIEGRKYAVAHLTEEGRWARDVLAEALPGLIGKLRFPLSMRWNASGVSFSRPIRWLVAFHGEQIIPFEYAGVPAKGASRGSRPRGSTEILIQRAEDHLDAMAQAGIVLGPGERQRIISEEVYQLAQGVGGRAEYRPEFLGEVANLIEEPQAILGSFPEEFLELPVPVLTTVMQKHQRYFPVFSDGGKLLPHFIAIANGKREDIVAVRQGNEAVIAARLADARFFFQEDIKQPLEAFVPKLATIAFQEELGSMRDKAERLEKLIPKLLDERIAPFLAEFKESQPIALRAAHLCKADLATQMVKELTSLQGVMGREYALRSGESPQVAEAIYGHYLPRHAEDELPADTPYASKTPSLILGIADRLDTLTGLFAIGLVPTGSADPYGLRRQALGLVRILISEGVGFFNLREAIRRAADGLPVPMRPEAEDALWEFLVERLRGEMRASGLRYDLVEAVLAKLPELGYDCVVAFDRVREFQGWVNANPQKFQALLPAFARTVRILRYTRERGIAPQVEPYPLDPEALSEPASKTLYEAYLKAEAELRQGDQLMEVLYRLAEPINAFFDQVLVVAQDGALLHQPEEEARRHNLLGLLQRIADLSKGWLDFSKLEGF